MIAPTALAFDLADQGGEKGAMVGEGGGGGSSSSLQSCQAFNSHSYGRSHLRPVRAWVDH